MRKKRKLGWNTVKRGILLGASLGILVGGSSQGVIAAINHYSPKPVQVEVAQEPVRELSSIETVVMADLNSLEGFTEQELAYLDLLKEYPLAASAVEQAAHSKENLAFHLARTVVEAGFEMKYRAGKCENNKEAIIESPAGALGIGAVMPATFQEYKKTRPQSDYSLSDLYSYNPSLEVGDWRFQERVKKRHDQLVLALLDYNKGHNDVNRLVEKYRSEQVILSRLRAAAEKNRKYREPAEYPLRILGIARVYDRAFRKLGIDYEADLSAEQREVYQKYIQDRTRFPDLPPDVKMVRGKERKFPKYLVTRCRKSSSYQEMLAQKTAADSLMNSGA
ncbi:MAG: transglycosylase SLT domain-containing protein [Nanoarchaeota archaeon]